MWEDSTRSRHQSTVTQLLITKIHETLSLQVSLKKGGEFKINSFEIKISQDCYFIAIYCFDYNKTLISNVWITLWVKFLYFDNKILLLLSDIRNWLIWGDIFRSKSQFRTLTSFFLDGQRDWAWLAQMDELHMIPTS